MRTKFLLNSSLLAIFLVGCSGRTSQDRTSNAGGATSTCNAGSERCDCYGNSTCNKGLECHSNLCVSVAGGGGSGAGGLWSGGGSTSTGAPVLGGSYSTGGASYSTGGASYLANTGGVVNNSGGGTTSARFDPSYCSGLLANYNCIQTDFRADVRTVNLLLVIDQSGSMNDRSSVTDTQTKWAEMQSALSSSLAPVAKDINFGLELFPYSGDLGAPGVDSSSADPSVACNVPSSDGANAAIAVDIVPGLDNLNAILDVVKSSKPAGGTPTAMALQQALDYFTLGNGKDLTGGKWILLVTDGGPNCNQALTCKADACTQNIDCKCGNGCDSTLNCCQASYGYICLDNLAVVVQLNKLALAGIKTFVVGIPGTEGYVATLNSMAVAGKMPNTNGAESYYAVSATNSLQALNDTFSAITAQLVKSCDIELKESPPDPASLNVVIDCIKLVKVPDDTAEDDPLNSGFWIDYGPSPAHLRLTGTVCTQLKMVGVESIDVISGCRGIN